MDSTAGIAVSVLIPVLNEEEYIREAVARMRAQDLDEPFELIFIDGGSTDGTKRILTEIAATDPSIRLLDNPHRRTPHALNIGLAAARGQYIARMDAHTYYPPSYLSVGVRRLRQGDVAWVSGPQLAEGVDTWSRRVALALSTPLGAGGAGFRRRIEEEVEVDSGFTGIWRRETLDRYDGWDERWPVDQDYELAARMRADGLRVICLPDMAAKYVPRNSITRLIRQYWNYGYYRVKTSVAHPASMRRSHVLPPGLAIAVLLAAVPSPARPLARLGVGIYAMALGAATAREMRRMPTADAASMPLVFACMHLAAGAGFVAGCFRFGPPVEAIAAILGARR